VKSSSASATAARSGTISFFRDGRIWCRSGLADPIERQAEMFSARLLMPRHEVVSALPAGPWSGWRGVYELANRFVVNATPMMIRLEELGLAHRDDDRVPVSGPRLSPASLMGPRFRQCDGTTAGVFSVGGVMMDGLLSGGQVRLRRRVLGVVVPTSSPGFWRRR
jgi:hypothetical protein